MARKRHSAEEIVNKLRQAEGELSKGSSVAAACKLLGVTEQTYYRWRKEYGGLKTDQAKKLKELERENARLKCPFPGKQSIVYVSISTVARRCWAARSGAQGGPAAMVSGAGGR